MAPPVKHMRFEYFSTSGDGHNWYWRLKAGNGRTIADGAEGYTSEANVIRAVNRFVQTIAEGWGDANIEVRKVDG